MKHRSVRSGNICSVAYDGITLEVLFSSGVAYRYAGVPLEAHRALLEESRRVERRVFGASVGALFARAIRGKYPCERVVSDAEKNIDAAVERVIYSGEECLPGSVDPWALSSDALTGEKK